MDENVLAAMARWPDVPDVFGWLSLSERGQWRLYPRGDGQNSDAQGETISSPQILDFINRNYACDAQGRWFFQNGPQRVFVRLDGAPYILQTSGPDPALRTHNGLKVERVSAWWLDDLGRLYAKTEHGPGLIAGRDLPAVLGALHTLENKPLMDALEHNPRPQALPVRQYPDGEKKQEAILQFCPAADIAHTLQFVRRPHPQGKVESGQPSHDPDTVG